jgi:hypothetical protein
MRARFPSIAAAALVACLALPGCTRKLSNANLDCVKDDMSPKEVESILGEPTRRETREMPLQTEVKTLPVLRYVYEQNGKTVTVHFVDGKMIGVEGSFDQ